MAATLRFSILISTTLVFAAALSAGACSSDDAGDGSDAGASNDKDGGPDSSMVSPPPQKPCDGELEDECGVKCSASKACADGLYCKSGACTADCTPSGRQCKATEICDAHGRCMADDGNIPDPNTTKDGGNTCIEQNLQYEARTPTVELLIDRSGSMDADFGGKDRWNTIRDILVDPTDGFVKKYESKIRFGLALYTTRSRNQCPDLIEVPFSFDNFQEIHDVFMANEIGDNTPTAESVKAVTAKLDAYDEPPIGPKIIVLATDGDPDTCDDPNSNGTEPPRQASLEAVEAAWDKNIATYVISVGPEATITHLQDLARAGQGGDADAEPYEALNSNALSAAFDAILGGVVSCDVDLNGEVTPENAAKGKITIEVPAEDGGVTMSPPLAYDDPDGYEMPTRSSVRILGDACDTIKSNPDAEVHIEFPCGTITIVQ